MANAPDSDKVHTVSRRYFLKSTAGVVAITILQPPTFGRSIDIAQAGLETIAVPGQARHRIDGRAKVTGEKVYARDFNARDMGWERPMYYAIFLRAVTTQAAFLKVNLDALPASAKPKHIVLGDQLSDAFNTHDAPDGRDLHFDGVIEEARNTARAGSTRKSFDRPGLDFDLIVRPGNKPDFLGQAVALLVFDSRVSYRAAHRFMQFRDTDFQIYEQATTQAMSQAMTQATTHAAPALGEPFAPLTDYVLWTEPGAKEPAFSYAGFKGESSEYLDATRPYARKIKDYIKADSSLIQQAFKADMSAMDPMFMEPEAGLAWYQSETQTMRLVLGTQSPDGDVAEVMQMYGEDDSPLTVTSVELTSCYPGGGFGGRDKSPFTMLLALAAAFADGNPIRLEYDRFEQFRVGLKRHACKLSGSLVVDREMTMKVIEMSLEFDGGGRKNLSPYVANLSALCAGGSYAFPMAKIHAQANHSQNVSGGSQRGFGGPQAFFAIETAVDEIAIQQSWDPINLRRHNLLAEGGHTVAGGAVDQELRLAEMFDVVDKHPLWANRAKLKDVYGNRDLAYGTGVAMSLQAYGTSGDGVVAAIMMDKLGQFTVRSDAVDMGNGSATTLGVVIGNILGANAVAVDMGDYTLFGDTQLKLFEGYGDRDWNATTQMTPKSVGSSSACLTGLHQVHVVQQVAHAFFAETLLPAARNLWGRPDVKAEETAWVDGQLTIKGVDAPPISLSDLAGEVYMRRYAQGVVGHAFFQKNWASADYRLRSDNIRLELDGLALYEAGKSVTRQIKRTKTRGPQPVDGRASRYVWSPCINVVGLTVNITNGSVRIENVLSVLNAGRIHVEPLVSGQSQGGIAQAIGWTLMEEVPAGMDGPANGTWNLNRYHVPRWQDVPLSTTFTPGGRAQELVLMPETPGDKGQGRGIAEAVMCSIAPAISNALRDAVGVRYSSLPITSGKIMKELTK